jgi:hypothetical protein
MDGDPVNSAVQLPTRHRELSQESPLDSGGLEAEFGL